MEDPGTNLQAAIRTELRVEVEALPLGIQAGERLGHWGWAGAHVRRGRRVQVEIQGRGQAEELVVYLGLPGVLRLGESLV